MFSLPRAAATQVWDAQQNVLCSRLGCARWMERRSEAMLSRRSLRLARVQQCRTMREELKEVVDEVTHNSGSLRGTYALLLQDYRTLKRSIRGAAHTLWVRACARRFRLTRRAADEAATFLQAMLRGWLCRRRLRAAAQRGHGKRHSSTASMPGFAAALTRNGNSGTAAASAAGGGKEDARRLPVLSPGTASIGIISPSSSAGATTPASSPPGGIVRGMPPGFDPSVRVNIGGSAALGSEVLNGVKRAVKSKLKEYDAAFRRAHNRLVRALSRRLPPSLLVVLVLAPLPPPALPLLRAAHALLAAPFDATTAPCAALQAREGAHQVHVRALPRRQGAAG